MCKRCAFVIVQLSSVSATLWPLAGATRQQKKGQPSHSKRFEASEKFHAPTPKPKNCNQKPSKKAIEAKEPIKRTVRHPVRHPTP